MSVGVWKPGKPTSVGLEKLRHWLAIYREADPDNLQASLGDDAVQSDAVFMKLDESAWQAADQLDDNELEDLIRFFTLAEMQLPNWQGGETSPVIYLVRELRGRDSFTPELRKWIKRHTDNRYLPYGPAL